MKYLVLFFSLMVMNSVYATPCGEVIYNKKGMLGKYRYANLSIFEGSKKYGSSSWTSGASTEHTTAIFDPGVWTGYSTSLKQSLSTEGACKWAGIAAITQHRTEFIAQNIDQIKIDLASGKGDFSEVLMSSYFCDEGTEVELQKKIKQNFVEMNLSNSEAKEIHSKINSLIKSDTELHRVCGLTIS